MKINIALGKDREHKILFSPYKSKLFLICFEVYGKEC
jgi:hypothetical protein